MSILNNKVQNLEEVNQKLEQSHLVYLQTEDSPSKIEHRQKLEGLIEDYLCSVSHDRKFFFKETADVLYRSALNAEDFSGYKACAGWYAISLYASNLLSQPWRKEYRNIRTFNGYYKHEIEANLVGAEFMFEIMGYSCSNEGVLRLCDPIDPDRVSNVSKDAIVAFVECQILKQIWEKLPKTVNISWLEILEFRRNYTGAPDQAVRALNHLYLEKMNNYRISNGHLRPQPIRFYETKEESSPVKLSQKFYSIKNSKKGFKLMLDSEPLYKGITSEILRNQKDCSNNSHEKESSIHQLNTFKDCNLRIYSTHDCMENFELSGSFRCANLDNIISNTISTDYSITQLSSNHIINENVNNNFGCSLQNSYELLATQEEDGFPTPKTSSDGVDKSDYLSTNSSFEEKNVDKSIDEKLNNWNCGTCTYLNTDLNVCQMCGKSRQKGKENEPLVSGGKECPKCTLINKKDVIKCEACDTNLNNSPTYI